MYELFYRWTLSVIENFSGNTVHFFGKIPFWFLGDPYFGFVFCSIPSAISLCYLLLKDKYENAFRWTLVFYLPILIVCFLLNCYTESIALVASNDFYQTGQTLSYNLRQININNLLFESIILTTIIMTIVNAFKRRGMTKKAPACNAHLQ
ncbi:hypothetical protein DN068_12030 [Taibaiella soli]|uniref:Uncharacterized protein n=1 Tax=Taibaiella soli TaxID=1649169 RepID=A0A2W2B9J8_9BACT|nr:hypothetical protein DN068_12030 [Taibaiella soli]